MPRAFKRWLEKWYPQDADVYDTYKTRRREWMPWKRLILQIGMMIVGLMIIIIPITIVTHGTEHTIWRDILAISALISAVCVGVLFMIMADIIYDRRSAKPTPPREKQ